MTEEAVTFPSAGLKLSGVVHVPGGMRPGERRAAFLVLHGFGSNKTSSNTMQPTKVLSELGYVVLRFDRLYHKWWQRTTADRRWAVYYDAMLTHSEAAAEVRLFGLANHFRSAYQTIRRRLRSERLAQMRKQSLAKLGASSAALLVSGITMAWMAWSGETSASWGS